MSSGGNRMRGLKRKAAAACMAATIMVGSSTTALAMPQLMSDGTVFDAQYYAQNNPDVTAVCGTDTAALFRHYQNYGRAEGRAPAEEGAVPVGTFKDETQTAKSQVQETDKSQTKQAKTQQEKDGAEAELEEQERLAQYYGESVFIGDSIMLGFRNYSAKQKTFVHNIQFLAAGSYSAGNALKPVEGESVHPKYKGKKYQVWDAVSLMGSKRAFVLLGMNDIAPLGLEGALDTYEEVLGKIEEASPGIEIVVISVTYTLEGEGKKALNNENIAKYNELLQGMAKENGWGYIDLCTPISDGKGNLAEGYCSDGFVHLSKTAYGRWERELIKYEKEHPAQVQEEADAEEEESVTSSEKSEAKR